MIRKLSHLLTNGTIFLAGIAVGLMIAPYLTITIHNPTEVGEITTSPKQETRLPAKEKSVEPEVEPYDCTKFSQAAVKTRKVSDIREDDFGTAEKHIPIWLYEGGKRLDEKLLRQTIRAVVLRFPNLKHTQDLQDLLFETMLVESNLMGIPQKLLEKYNNFGIAQFRMDTAEETIDWLRHVRKDAYDVLMTLYKRELSLKDNLRQNIPFSVALMAQYYWRVAPDIYPNITTMKDRGILWKSVYNTPKGLGTVNAYMARVKKYYGTTVASR